MRSILGIICGILVMLDLFDIRHLTVIGGCLSWGYILLEAAISLCAQRHKVNLYNRTNNEENN